MRGGRDARADGPNLRGSDVSCEAAGFEQNIIACSAVCLIGTAPT